jgi:hypothetical protein
MMEKVSLLSSSFFWDFLEYFFSLHKNGDDDDGGVLVCVVRRAKRVEMGRDKLVSAVSFP